MFEGVSDLERAKDLVELSLDIVCISLPEGVLPPKATFSFSLSLLSLMMMLLLIVFVFVFVLLTDFEDSL
jgi:hypothetical protein